MEGPVKAKRCRPHVAEIEEGEGPVKAKCCRPHVAEIEEGEEAASQPQQPPPRKRREGGGVGDDDDKEEGEQRAVREEEVEEFYAILQSVREARRLGGRARARAEEIWQPQFAWEDFQYRPGCSADDDGKKKTTAAAAAAAASATSAAAKKAEGKIGKVFDLNAQPAAGLGDC